MSATLENVHIVCTAMLGRLAIGRTSKRDPQILLEQRDCEKEVMIALRDYMMRDAPKGSSKTFQLGEQKYKLTLQPVEVLEP